MIESINDLIEKEIIDHDKYKPIDLREVELGMDLDIHSKLNRDPDFLETLMERGEAKASALWTGADPRTAQVSQ